jgi:lysyl-tRNA synthetase, class II
MSEEKNTAKETVLDPQLSSIQTELGDSDLSEQSRIRREKLNKIREIRYPYPNDSKPNSTAQAVRELVEKTLVLPTDEPQKESIVTLAGRINTLRQMGKASFFNIQDSSGKIQVYIKKDQVDEAQYEEFTTYDIGDIIEVKGYAFRTKTGEPSLHATEIRLLVKCLHPLPEKWHGLTDVEVRYRRRYLDLIVNPEVRDLFLKRAAIIREIRAFFDERQYIEVETPFLHSIRGGASARPFMTHHNALDMSLNLRIALELHLKRIVVGGIDRVYEIGRIFRNEGVSSRHNPEFTMLEFYQAYATYEDFMVLTEELFVRLCNNVLGTRKVQYGEKEVDFTAPYARVTMAEAVYVYGGLPRSISLDTLEGVHAAGKHFNAADLSEIKCYGMGIYELFDRYAQPNIVDPVFITKHPVEVSPLSRPALEDLRFTDRFEMFVAGMEVANAFSELNDSEDQYQRFLAQIQAAQNGDEEAMEMDHDFVEALEYGLPPTAGQGIGIDRLVMILTGQTTIRDVILFPTMRAEKR